MGMLKHFGYSDQRVRHLYARRVAHGCRTAMVLAGAYGIILTTVLLGQKGIFQGLLVALVIAAVVVLVQGPGTPHTCGRPDTAQARTAVPVDRRGGASSCRDRRAL